MNDKKGAICFAQIPGLPDRWWSDPSSAWEVWDKDTIYLWGANASNYDIIDPDRTLAGGGMAGPQGPTRGHGNPNYVGIITTSLDDRKNDAVFGKLENHLAGGNRIVVPTFNGKWALGSGLAVGWFSQPSDWWKSQAYIVGRILDLMDKAATVMMSPTDFWPDCAGDTDCAGPVSASSPGVLEMATRADLEVIHAYLKKKY